MAEDVNSVFLVGRLTRDMDLSHTNGGYPLGKLSLAVNRRRKNGEQWEDEANFFDLVLWGKRAEALQRYLLKGTQIVVQGNLKQERWEQDGQKRSRVTIDVNNIQLVGSRSGGESNSSSYAGSPASGTSGGPDYSFGGSSPSVPGAAKSPPPSPSPIGIDNEFEDDIPF
ncbi:single-stranded DNA-binding protein [Candidatus Haliotispira prima]|uniref:Single-stranded DNA-binding protein n=1 Tax=Candidatus Haliotispira prima TaxID=3034016 RepID=A0ABY8MEY9_9SPIO|nr:single-stranded DNA-binding protein [Candidatus Haliotispira prima]